MAGEACNVVSKRADMLSTMGKGYERGYPEGVSPTVDQESIFPMAQ